MAKSIVITLISFFLVSSGSDSPLVRTPHSTPSAQNGILQKLIVAKGSVSMKVDLNRLNGRRGRVQETDLRFNADPNTFFTIVVFNDELRRIEPSSMALIPQNTASLPSALNAAYQQLALESTAPGDQFELVVRDKNTGFTFFNIEGQQNDYSAKEQLLAINSGRILLSEEFAKSLGRPADAGVQVGDLTVSINMRPIEIIQVVDGESKSSVMPPVEGVSSAVPGPDVIVGDLVGLAQFGSSSGTQVGLAVGTDSCNAGSVPLNWLATPNNDHPVIPQNLYRMSGGTGNDQRFEQVGQSSVKHAFTALQDNICGFGCNATPSTTLGVGCSDPYSASLNAGQSNNSLGSRAWINPFTGAFPRGDSPTPPNSHAGHTHTGPSHRILVEMSDLNTSLNAGATYYAEAQYVTPHEYAWCQSHPGQCNMSNNASYRRYNVSGTTSFSFSPVGATERQKPAISAWNNATIVKIEPAPGTDGIGYVAYKVTNTAPGVWHYEYVVYNQNLDRSIQSFSVPVATGTSLTNIGFHAPPQHPGWANDGTVGNTGYSATPWTQTQAADSIAWTTQTFAQNPNANAIRWGTLYNFRFDSDRPPQLQNATVGFFKTGAPIQVQVESPNFQSAIAINDVTVTETDAGTVAANFNVSLTPASTDTVTVQWATADGLATAGSDYVAASGTVTFTPGQTSQPVSITVNSDNLVEPNETFFVNLSNATNASITDAQGLGTINNDDVIAALPSSFNETQITGNGLSNTTAMALHPDGRIFVCQQTGELRVIKNNVVLPTPFTTVTVNSTGERGLLGIAFDPNYTTNRFVYVYYTATSPTTHNRVSRFTADATNEDVAVAGSEVVLLDLETLGATNHNGGAIHFGPDGKLYIAVGENAVSSNAQSLSNRLGKILRLNSDGTIPSDNPTSFPNISGSPTGVNRAIWAVGVRNPFTFTFQPGTGRMHINDVGQNTWEEINVGVAGANYGWPTCEGTCSSTGMTNPIYQYSSAVGTTCAITGGAFYNPTTPTFPGQYIGKYFFADFCGGWMKTIDPLSPPATGTAPDFITAINSPVDIQVANDGSLYYLARGSNSVFRVQYFGGPTLAIDNVTIGEGNGTANFTVWLSPAASSAVTVQYATANGSAAAGSDYTATSGTLTFAPGQTSQTIPIVIQNDTIVEPNETFNVNLSNATNATIGNSQGVGTIIDNDLSTISINDPIVTEGNTGTTTATFTISLSNMSSQNVTVNYATAGNTATSGVDFVPTSGTATIPANSLSTTVQVTVNSDTIFEPGPNETFFVNLTNPTNATIADAQGIGSIIDNDPEPTITINDVTIAEGNSGTSNAAFTVSLSNPSSQTITVQYATADSSANAGSDYVATSGTLTFNPGQLTQTINVTVNGDATLESNETFNVNLANATNASIVDNQGVGTITNDDTQPNLSINDVSIAEGSSGTSIATFTVSLSSASSQTVTVNYATADSSATAGSDYVSTSGTLTFNPGQLSQSISVTINGDTTFEPNEAFNVNLSSATNAGIGDTQGVGTITNDDAQPSLSINDVSVAEGSAGTSTATFTVSLSNASSQTITVNYATANGSATAGDDYLAGSGTLTFNPGQLSQTINVTINGDTTFEPNETFNVNLTSPANATISDSQGVGTITNDDTQPTISINDVSVNEGDSGTSTATFTVSLSNASSQTITVNYATSNGTATAGNEYVAMNGTLTFTPGQTTQSVNVTINGDIFNEPSVTFNVDLTSPSNATILDAQGVGTITDDDAPLLAFEQSSQRAIALDAVTFVRDPFPITNPNYFGPDKRTRVILFSENLLQTSALNVTARAIDTSLTSHDLVVEFVGTLPTFPGFTQIVVKLPDGITMAGDLQVTITARGKTSNTVLVGVIP
jgi:glucose/arabinose dehydrogenase